MKNITFPYTIFNGELIGCEKILKISPDKITILGIKTDGVLSGVKFVTKTAFFISVGYHTYGNETMTFNQFMNILNSVCCPPVQVCDTFQINADCLIINSEFININ